MWEKDIFNDFPISIDLCSFSKRKTYCTFLKYILKHFIYPQNSDNNGVSETKKQNTTDKCLGVRCGRGKCIDLRQVCNGVRNCEDGNDESEVACEMKHEFCAKDPHDKYCGKHLSIILLGIF